MGRFLTELDARKVSARKWKLLAELKYKTDDKRTIKAPVGFTTDFASVPRVFWRLAPPDGAYTKSAVIHDWMYYSQKYPRKYCDQIFLEAMGVQGVKLWKRRLMYRAVRLFGWIGWRKRAKEAADE